MKKIKISLLGLALLILVVLGFFITCEIGLGKSVDTKPPTVSISYPANTSIIRDSFYIVGIADDETSLDSVNIKLRNEDKDEEVGEWTAEYSDKTKQWHLLIENERKLESDGEYGQPRYPDGKYEVIVTAIDGAKRETKTSATYFLDNSAPVMLLGEPISRGSDPNANLFSEAIVFKGDIWDRNDPEKIVFDFYAFEDSGSFSEGEYITNYTMENPGSSFVIIMGKKADGSVDKEYLDLVGDIDKDASVTERKFTWTATVYDNAWRYQDKDGKKVEKVGNKTQHYFISDDITQKTKGGKRPHTELLASLDNDKTYKNKDLFELSFSDLKAMRIPSVVDTENFDKTKYSSVAIDPHNKSPWTEIIGMRDTTDTKEESDDDYKKNTIAPGSNLTIKINRGPDNYPIKYDGVVEDEQITISIFEKDKDEVEENAFTYNGVSYYKWVVDEKFITIAGSSYFASFLVPGLTGAYKLEINAKDSVKESLRKNRYVYTLNQGPPLLESVEPYTGYGGETKIRPNSEYKFKITVVGKDVEKEIYLHAYTIDENQIITKVTSGYPIKGEKLEDTVPAGDMFTYEWELDWQVTEITNKFGLAFQLKDGTYDSNMVVRWYRVDDEAPVLKSISSPVVSNPFPESSGLSEQIIHSSKALPIHGKSDEDFEKIKLIIVENGDAPSSSDWENKEKYQEFSSTGVVGDVRANLIMPDEEGLYDVWYRLADDVLDQEKKLVFGDPKKFCTVLLDLHNPIATMEVGFSDDTIEYDEGGTEFRKGEFTLSGDCDDSAATPGRKAKTVSLAVTKDGANLGEQTINSNAVSSGEWNYTQSVNTTTNEDDGLYVYTLTVTDIAGKTTTVSKTVRIDSTPPTIDITNPASGEQVASQTYTFRGTANDPGGVGFKEIDEDVEYKLTGSDDWVSLGPLSGTINWTKTNVDLGDEGPKTLEVRSTDKLGNTATMSRSFYYDVAAPSFEETTVNTEDIQNISSDLTFRGMVSDSNSSGSINISVTINSETPANVGTYTADGNNKIWNYTFTSGRSDGLYNLVFTARDAAGRETKLTRNVRVDNTAPTISITHPITGGVVGSSYNFRGTASDGGSDLEKIEYSFDNSSWEEASGLDSWSAFTDLTGKFGDDEGPKTIYLRATDNAGNYSDEERNFIYDTANPELTVESDALIDTKDGFSLKGKATDSYGIASISVKQSKDGGTAVEVAGNGLNLTGVVKNREWELINLPRNPSSPSDQLVADGTYIYTIEAIDLAGKPSISQTVTVRIDTTPPNVNNITAPGTGQTGLNALSGSAYVFRGNASDAGLGVVKIWYAITKDTTAPNDIGDYTEHATTGGWSFSKTLGSGNELEEGLGYYIYVLAEDSAGNRTLFGSAANVKFDVDLANPEFTETTSNITDATLVTRKTNVNFGGAVSDANGITSVVVTYKKDGGSSQTLLNDTSGSGTWSTTLPLSLGNGIYELNFIATDKAGKTTSFTRNVAIDTEGPAIEITNPLEDSWATSGDVTVRGTASDLTGVRALYYSLDGTAPDVPSTPSTDNAWTALGWTKANGTTSWTIPLTSLAEGNHKVWIGGVDTVDNVSDVVSCDFGVDLDRPTLTASTPPQYTNVGFSITGTASDTNALVTTAITVMQKKGNGDFVEITTNGPSTSNDWADWELLNLPRNPSSIGAQLTGAAADDEYEYLITARDVAGKTREETRNVVFDATAPSIDSVTGINENSWYTSSSIAITGTASDAGSGLDRIEYRTNSSASWNVLTGTGDYNGTVSFADGSANQFEIRAVDRAGNISQATTRTVKVDTVDPSFEITSATTSLICNGTKNAAVEIESSDATSGPKTVYARLSNRNWGETGTVSETIDSNGEATITIPAASLNALSDGAHQIYLRVEDNAGRYSAPISLSITIDKTAPTVSVISHANNAVVNKTISLSGIASDANGLADDGWVFERNNGGTWTTIPATITPGNSWSVTEFYTIPLGNGTHSVRIGAPDVAGNMGYAVIPLNIDQHSDRPVVKLTNIEIDGSSTLKMVSTVYGTVSDDDGIDTFEISENGTAWLNATSNPDRVSYDNGVWSYESSDGDGNKSLWFRIKDTAGTTFVSGATNDLEAPKVTDGKNSGPTKNAIAYKVDKVPPVIGGTILANNDPLPELESTVFGGSNNTVYFELTATDANGVKAVFVEIDGLSKIPMPNVSGEIYRSAVIDLSVATDGYKSVVFEAEDNSGLKATAPRTILVDNTPPSVTIQSPINNTEAYGDIEVKGTTNDGLGAGVKSVHYQVGKNANIAPDSSGWIPVDEGTLGWQINFKDGNKIDNFASADYGTAVPGSDGLFIVPIIIRAEDKAGNVRVTSKDDYWLKLDPDGDKPRVTVVYPAPDDENRTMGGTIRIFGTAQDNESVKAVYMQIANDANGNDIVPGWGGEGKLANGTLSWNMTINQNKEFEPEGDGTKKIWFRVRARDNNNLDGNWSSWYEIEIDKDVPHFGSSEFLQLKQGATIRDYVADMYVKGDWVLGGSIEDDSGIAKIVISGDISGTLDDKTPENDEIRSWFEEVIKIVDGKEIVNYRMKIPVNTTTTGTGTGSLSFSITATEKSEQNLFSTESFYINYDNEAPTINAYTGSDPVKQSNNLYTLSSSVVETGSGFERVAFYFLREEGTNTRIYNPMESRVGDANRTNLSTLTMVDGLPRLALTTGVSRLSETSLTHTAISNNKNIRKGGLIKIGGVDRLIVNVVGNTVEWADHVDTSVTEAWIAYALVVDNMTIETPVWGENNEIVSITNDDGDGMIESVERTGGLYSWTASIDSRNIPDGPIKICYVAYDKAGNYDTAEITTKVENNPPLLAAVTLGTDLDGSGIVDGSEKVPAFSALDGQGNKQAAATVATSAFMAKGLTTVDIDVVGGNSSLQYNLTVGGTTVSGHSLTLGNLRTDEGSGVKTITLTVLQLTSVGEGAKTFVFNIWDSTEMTAPGTDSLRAVLTMPIIVDVIDEVAPVTVVDRFYWNSEDDNSLYENSKLNGHIELEADLPSLFNQSSGLFDSDPKVSGKISIRGTAYDNSRLNSLYVFFGDTGTTSSFTFTGNSGNATFGGRSYSRVATYNTGSGNWTGTGNWATNGWEFTVTDNQLDQSGHLVKWQLDIDTRRVTGVAALDRLFRVVAQDARPNGSSETEAYPSGDVHERNIPNYRMDVVPYITEIRTPLRNDGGLKDINIRSSSGKYSIMKGYQNTFIAVSGFNLNPNAVRLVTPTEAASRDTETTTGVSVARRDVSSDRTSFNLTNNLDRSGYLEVFTNGVRSLNNVNNNDAKGDYTGLDEYSMYNREPDRYIRNNMILNDDRYLRVFDIKDTGIKNGYYPDMLMDGNDPVFGYVDLNGINPISPLTTYQNQCYQPQRAKFNATTGNLLGNIEYLIGGLSWDQMSMTRDEAGRYIHASVYNYSGAYMSVIYNSYARDHTWSGYTDGWGDGVGYSGYGGVFANEANNNAISVDAINYTPGALIGRYQNLKILSKGNSTTTTGASIYMAYYDDNSATKDIIFRTFKIGTNTSWTNVLNNGRSNLPERNTSGRRVAATHTSNYLDMAVTSNNIVVIVYHDFAEGKLKLIYSNGGIDGSTITPSQTFVSSSVDFPEYVGPYVSMTLDSNNGIHIAAYDTSDSDLVYMYLPSYSSNTSQLKTFKIDQAFAVGTWTKVKVKESGGDITPYIAYYNSSETGSRESIKLAFSKYAVGSPNFSTNIDSTTKNVIGTWDYMTVPSKTPAQGGDVKFKQVNLDFDNSGRPVVGYLGTNLEFGTWLNE